MIVPANHLLRKISDLTVGVRLGQFQAVHQCPQPMTMTAEEWEQLQRQTLDLLVCDFIRLKHGLI